MTAVVGCTGGHYEVQKTSYGEAYVWCPGCVMVGCDCGERVVLTGSEAFCRCGADHTALVRKELAGLCSSQGALHPWDEEYREWRRQQGEYLWAESHDWLEWRVIE